MNILVKGFDEEIAESVKKVARKSLDDAIEWFLVFVRTASIKADISIQDGNLVIERREEDE